MVPVAVKVFGVGIVGIWVIMFIDVWVQAAVFSWVHFRGRWLRTEV
jgi:Na+-driven multidrug efflux pump